MINSPSIAYLNGHFLPKTRCYISIDDRGFLFGDGVFTTIKLESGRYHHLNAHLRRLKKQCEKLGIQAPTIEPSAFQELCQRNQANTGTWRVKILVTGGESEDLILSKRPARTVLMTLSPYSPPKRRPLRLGAYPIATHGIMGQIKSLAYLERLHIKQWAQSQHFDDALSFDPNDYLLEASYANFFWIDGNTLYTPSKDLPLLWGVMLSTLLDRIEKIDLKAEQVHARLCDIPKQAHLFLSNSLIGIQEIKSIETTHYPIHEMLTKKLRELCVDTQTVPNA